MTTRRPTAARACWSASWRATRAAACSAPPTPPDAVGVPGVDLATADHHLLRRRGDGGQLAGDLGTGLARQEADLVALRVRGDLAEGIALDHAGQLLAGADDHLGVDAQPGCDF